MERLFRDGDLSDTLRAVQQGIPEKVNGITADQFTASTDEQIVEHLVSTLQIETLQIYEGQREMEQQETKVDVTGRFDYGGWLEEGQGPLHVPGTEVTVSIPFTGEQSLWRLKPNPWRMSFPQATILPPRGGQGGLLILAVARPHAAKPEEFRRDVENALDDVRDHLNNQRNQIQTFNQSLPTLIFKAVRARRDRLSKHASLSEVLGIPLKHRADAPPIEPIRIERKITKPLPPPSKTGLKPDPGIPSELYETILKIIRHVGRTFETTPKTYKVHDEEELRDIMLANLNGHFTGGATGETFRKKGKTDVRIEDEDRSAFVGECAVWRGQKELSEKLDQLLGYLTWRDCKAAIIVFNKDVASFSQLFGKIQQAMASHRFLLKDLGQQGDGEWRYVFRSEEDEGRQITVHVFLFNLFA